jgi:hypothetical protein
MQAKFLHLEKTFLPHGWEYDAGDGAGSASICEINYCAGPKPHSFGFFALGLDEGVVGRRMPRPRRKRHQS